VRAKSHPTRHHEEIIEGKAIMKAGSVILLEFNELCPQLMQKFMRAGHLPHFSRFYGESHVHTTVADEVAPNLDPWIQWITVHSGVPYKTHKIQDLGDGHKLAAKNVWDLVSDAGDDVWVCGSMNLSYKAPIKGWVLPDPWTTKTPPTPSSLATYFNFVSANVTEYTSGKVPLSKLEQAKFIAFMASHGLSVRTTTAIVKQLLAERIDRKSAWKRAVILDKLQMDVFASHWRRARPRFSTFFLNSTAHFQHLYWRNMEPEHFKVKPAPGDQAVYQDAILFGYKEMDGLLGQFIELAGTDTTLVFSTAFSQQPFLAYEDAGGKTPYRPRDFDKFLAAIGITAPAKASPVMTHQFHLDFANEAEAMKAAAVLAALRYEGKQAMMVERDGAKIFGGCQVYSRVPADAVLTVEGSTKTHSFYELLYHIDLVKSGMHHPDGMFWIRTPERTHTIEPKKVPLVDVAPTLCKLLGIAQPSTMVGKPVGPLGAKATERAAHAAE
jgi:hypothetical protein